MHVDEILKHYFTLFCVLVYCFSNYNDYVLYENK